MEPEQVFARDAGRMPLVASCRNSVVSESRVLMPFLEYQWYSWDWAPLNNCLSDDIPPFTEHRQLLNSLDVFPLPHGGN